MSKKQSAIIRIIAWGVVAVALIVVLLLGMRGRLWNFNSGGFSLGFGSGDYYKDASKYQPGNASIDGTKVDALEINWIDGSVDVEVYDGNTVEVSETAGDSLDDSDKLHYYNRDGRLIIQYRKAENKFFTWFGSKQGNKQLLVRIPKSTAAALKELEIDTVSTQSTISGITADIISMDSTSGDFDLKNCGAGTLEMDSTSGGLKGELLKVAGKLDAGTTSGDADVEGTFGRVNFDSVSGRLTLNAHNCPEKIETDTVSGDVVITIPEGEGFTSELDSVSGAVTSEFPVTQKGDKVIYEDGGADFSFDSVSGDVKLQMQAAKK